jgi:2-iminobutanoate/2-iminopropanoate deaminase
MKQIIATNKAPKAIGPYSQAAVWNGLVFLSGQIPLDPQTGTVVEGGVAAQTEQVLNNIKAVLEASGSSLDKVVKTTVFLKDIGKFGEMNAVYEVFFSTDPPARSTVEVARLPRDVQVEIDCIAVAG